MPVSLLGIRHHGPGSSRHVVEYLKNHKPDLILIEAPQDAEILLPFLQRPDLKPPVAMFGYQIDSTQNSVFYPFASFSPEWQAMQYAKNNDVPVQFMDLPLTNLLALHAKQQEEEKAKLKDEENLESNNQPTDTAEKNEDKAEDNTSLEDDLDSTKVSEDPNLQQEECEPDYYTEPLDYLASIDGISDGELWWEINIEQRRDGKDVFEAVQVAITELREALPCKDTASSYRESLREAWMRKVLRAAQKQYENIVVVCGAWHVPALHKMPTVKADNELLKGLPKVKVGLTWVPWTYSRLSFRCGYGAGINSPGWYHHLFYYYKDDGERWLTKVASLLRKAGQDISVAHVIETFNLAHSLAALRNLSHPSLNEFNEAITTVMGFGDSIVLDQIRPKLIVSDRLGKIPNDVPKVPLVHDVLMQLKKLRLTFEIERTITLDLRKQLDLDRSIFFNRLNLLGINWAQLEATSSTNTFKEQWKIDYHPELMILLIERSIYGSTVELALTAFVQEHIQECSQPSVLTELLYKLIPCDMPQLVMDLTARLDTVAAGSGDILELMDTIPSLVKIIRYGSVRKFDVTPISKMLYTLVVRVLAGGVLVCINIDADVAKQIEKTINQANYAVKTLDNEEITELWLNLMQNLQLSQNVHPLLVGMALRILREHNAMQRSDLEQAISFYTSFSNEPKDMAFWLEGFLYKSGVVLCHDNELWMLVNNFLQQLDEQSFIELLPILRRTFNAFEDSELSQLSNKAYSYYTSTAGGNLQVAGSNNISSISSQKLELSDLDMQNAMRSVSVVASLLGIALPSDLQSKS